MRYKLSEAIHNTMDKISEISNPLDEHWEVRKLSCLTIIAKTENFLDIYEIEHDTKFENREDIKKLIKRVMDDENVHDDDIIKHYEGIMDKEKK